MKSNRRKHRAIIAPFRSRSASLDQLETRILLAAATWMPGVNLPIARGGATALSTGSGILVLGGKEAATAPTTVYQFDEFDGVWTKATALEDARTGAGIAQTLYSNSITYSSNIFLFGGILDSHATATTFNYDPRPDGDSANGPSMHVARSSFANTSDPTTGDLYAIGGLSASNAPLASAERYDPQTDSWSDIAPLPQAIYGATAAADAFGHLFVIGGSHTFNGAPLASVYRYTVSTDTWNQVASLNTGLRNSTAVSTPDGKIYLIGGQSASGAVASVESYNPALDTWSDEMPLSSPLYSAAATVDFNNNLYVIGGFNQAGNPVSTVSFTAIIPGVLVPYTPAINIDTNYFTFDAAPHEVGATALGTDGVTPVDGMLTFTYNGSPDAPTNAGDYRVIATFTSADPDYLSTVIAGDLYIDQATPKLTLTGGGTIKYDGQPHPAFAKQVGIDGTTPVDGTLAITYNGNSAPPVTQGTYTVLATFTSSDPNYTSTSATTTITIPDPTIPTGLTAVGASTTSIHLSWDPVVVPVSGYNIYERHVLHDPKGSGSTITYPLVASNIQGTDVTISVAAGGPASIGHTYYVSSISPSGIVSPRFAPASGQALYAPSLYGALLGGVEVSSANVQAGQSVQITLLAYGNLYPTFSLVSGPSNIAVDPITGVVTYSPSLSESGDITATFKATNGVGSAAESFVFHVLPAPTVADVSINAGGTTPLVTAPDGLRLLPAGRNTDLPTAGFNTFTITLTATAPLSPSDITVKGISGIDYGPVTLSSTGQTYTITLAHPINAADRVTISLGNSAIPTWTRRLDVLPGDVTDDGQVNFADLVLIAQHFGQPGTTSQGDLTADGQIDFADLVQIAQNYGTSLPAAPVSAAPALASLMTAATNKTKSNFSTARVKVTPAPIPAPIRRHTILKKTLT